jgi:hypothetical protein
MFGDGEPSAREEIRPNGVYERTECGVSSRVQKRSFRSRLQVADSKSLNWAEKLVNKHLILEGQIYTTVRVVSAMGICTKPLARRTLPRVRGPAVGEGSK